MDYRILGPLEIWDGGNQLEIRQRRHRALLAALLLRLGEFASVDQLVDDLYGEQAPATAKGSLQNMVSALRKTLGAETIVTRPGGYALDVERERVDLFRFERLLEEARTTARTQERAEKLQQALALWRGPALADLAFEPFVLLEAPRLDELHLAAREELSEARLALGEHVELIPDLESLLAEHPFNERLRGQLMLALYRAGRQAEALDLYRETRRLLVEKLGLEPGEQLRELEQAILRHDPALAPSRPRTPSLLPMRKTATVLYAQLIAASRLDELDPEALDELLGRYATAAQQALEENGGTTEILPAGAAFAVFGVPRTHEDDALRALRGAVALRSELEALGDYESQIGISTGEVFAGGAQSTALVSGAVVNVAKRLQERAASGEIVLGASTVRLVRDAVTVEALQPLRLGGETPLGAWRLNEIIDDAPAIPRRFEAPLVGRRQELAELRRAFDACRANSQCQLSILVGEPGIGKTRLAREFLAGVGEEASVLVGRCTSYGEGATWLPLLEILRQAGLETTEALSSLLSGDPDGGLVTRCLANLLGLSDEPNSLGETTWAFRRLFEALAARGPLVLVFEDVHWAQRALLDLIGQLAERASGPMLVLCLSRPELLETLAGQAQHALTLESLSEAEVSALVDALQAELAAGVRARVVELAEGNPLFAEQLVAHAQEEDAEGLDLAPPSIEALLASRLDLVSSEERALLQAAAVIGRRFPRAAAVELSKTRPAHAGISLRSLTDRGFVRPGADVDSLAFHHALTRNVVYAEIPKRARADLHEGYATWFEEARAELVELNEVLGYHLEQAARYKAELGEPDAALAEKAAGHLAAAGRRALLHVDEPAAASLLGRALDLTRPLRLDVRLELDLADVFSAADPQRAAELAEAAAVDAQAAGNEADEALARVVAAGYRLYLAADLDLDELEALAIAALPPLERAGDHAGLARVWGVLAFGVANIRGRYEEMAYAAEQAIQHARHAGRSEPNLSVLALALIMGPRPADEALGALDAALPDNPRPPEMLLRGVLVAMLGRFDEAWTLAREANDQLRALRGDTEEIWLGEIAELAGDYEAAADYFRRSFESMRSRGIRGVLSGLGPGLARVLCAQGRHEEAKPLAELGRRLANENDVWPQVVWRQAQALVDAASGKHADGERRAREAVAIAELTDGLNLQGDALGDLGEVLVASGRTDEAVTAVEQALERYERKKNLAMVARTRIRLAELRASFAHSNSL